MNGGKNIKAEQEMQKPEYRNLFRVSKEQQGDVWGLSQTNAGKWVENEASEVMKWVVKAVHERPGSKLLLF